MGIRIGLGILAVLLALAVAGTGLRLYMDRGAETRLRPGENVAIAALHGPLPQNAFLACPPGYCRGVGSAASPVFAMPADQLYWSVVRLVTGEPRVSVIVDDPQRRRLALIQRSALFGFPDIVIAEVVALRPGRSSLALYSRARYGRYDFGVNRRRVEGWLGRLAAAAPRQ